MLFQSTVNTAKHRGTTSVAAAIANDNAANIGGATAGVTKVKVSSLIRKS